MKPLSVWRFLSRRIFFESAGCHGQPKVARGWWCTGKLRLPMAPQRHKNSHGLMLLMGLASLSWSATLAQEIKKAAELGLSSLPPDAEVLVLESDPTLKPVEPMHELWADDWKLPTKRGFGSGAKVQAISNHGSRTGCTDEGFTSRAYARDSGNDWPWLPANTLVADDLTLEPGDWVIGCYDVLIYADNSAAYGCNVSRTVTVRAYDACNGTLIPGSQESWLVPAHGGPVLLTGVTSIDFQASGTIWFGLTTSINECDGWYIGQQQYEGSTTNVFQLATDCEACINPPTCSPWAAFIVILYGCTLPEVTSQPSDADICTGGWHQFCVNVNGSGTIEYQWQLDGDDITGATSPCYVATLAGSYQCIVTDDCGTVTSASATLTLKTGPTITAQPIGGLTCATDVHQVCVAADAIGELHYQWKRNSLTIIGATSDCYDALDPGTYTCVLTDDCGSTTSDVADVILATPESGDFDGDGSSDLADWYLFYPCMSGAEGGVSAGCECIDTRRRPGYRSAGLHSLAVFIR